MLKKIILFFLRRNYTAPSIIVDPGGGGINSLDFSQEINSGYLGVM